MTVTTMKKLTPVLVMHAVEPSLEFWEKRLGFTRFGIGGIDASVRPKSIIAHRQREAEHIAIVVSDAAAD